MQMLAKPATRGLLLLLTGLLTACGGGDFQDIEAFMAEVDSQPKGAIEPLPPFPAIPPFAYQASTMRSPFEPPVVIKKVKPNESGVQVKPDFNRVKQFLEQYTIAQLAMVGTLAQSGNMFALVRDSEGGVHRVQRGDYLGTDHGRIQSIEEGAVELIEIVSDGTGGWVQRARTVTLAGGE